MEIEYLIPLDEYINIYLYHKNFYKQLKYEYDILENVEDFLNSFVLLEEEKMKYSKLKDNSFSTFLNLKNLSQLSETEYREFSNIMGDFINLESVMIISIINKFIEKQNTNYRILNKVFIAIQFELVYMLYTKEYINSLTEDKNNIILNKNKISIMLK